MKDDSKMITVSELEFNKLKEEHEQFTKWTQSFIAGNTKLVELPCPVGTQVFKFEKNIPEYPMKVKVTAFYIYEDSIWFVFDHGLGRDIKDWNKWVFPSRGEAEKRYRELKAGVKE